MCIYTGSVKYTSNSVGLRAVVRARMTAGELGVLWPDSIASVDLNATRRREIELCSVFASVRLKCRLKSKYR